MILQTFSYPDLAIRSYVVGDPDKRECVVIDPPRVTTAIQTYLKLENLKLKAILETHVHADFISGALELKHAYDNKPLICCSEAGGAVWRPRYTDRGFNDGDTISLGSVLLRARYTPGHTPEHLTWLCFDLHRSNQHPVCAFTGDFLFVGGVGRPDLFGPSLMQHLLRELHKSLFTRFADLPDALRIFPSHGEGSLCGKSIGAAPSSTLGEQRRLNPAFQGAEMSSWLNNMETNMPLPPKNFARNKKLNLEGTPLLETLPKDNLKPTSEQIQQFVKTGWIFDFRDPQAFGYGHAPRAINIPVGPSTGNWLGGFIPEDAPLLCILPSFDVKERIANLIRVLGYSQALSFVLWEDIDEQDAPSTPLEAITAQKLHDLQQQKDGNYIIDVRTPEEWKEGHLEQAHHIELFKLTEMLRFIPRDQKIITYCRSGSRSSIAASILQKEGFKKVTHLSGGIKAWEDSSFPTIKE